MAFFSTGFVRVLGFALHQVAMRHQYVEEPEPVLEASTHIVAAGSRGEYNIERAMWLSGDVFEDPREGALQLTGLTPLQWARSAAAIADTTRRRKLRVARSMFGTRRHSRRRRHRHRRGDVFVATDPNHRASSTPESAASAAEPRLASMESGVGAAGAGVSVDAGAGGAGPTSEAGSFASDSVRDGTQHAGGAPVATSMALRSRSSASRSRSGTRSRRPPRLLHVPKVSRRRSTASLDSAFHTPRGDALEQAEFGVDGDGALGGRHGSVSDMDSDEGLSAAESSGGDSIVASPAQAANDGRLAVPSATLAAIERAQRVDDKRALRRATRHVEPGIDRALRCVLWPADASSWLLKLPPLTLCVYCVVTGQAIDAPAKLDAAA